MARRGVVALCLALAGGLASTAFAHQVEINGAPLPVASASGCARNLDWTAAKQRSWAVASEVRGRIWQWPASSDQTGRLRIVAVEAHAGAAVIEPHAAVPTMTDPETLAKDSGAVAVINGDFFETLPRGDALPLGAVVRGGQPVFVPAGWSPVVVWNAKGRLRTTHIALDADVQVDGKSIDVVALNDPTVTGSRIAVMTSAWQRRDIPDGLAALIVKADRVVGVHRKSRGVRIPRHGFALVAKSPSSLPRVAVGAVATMNLAVTSSDKQKIVHAAGHGGVLQKDGIVVTLCSTYERLLRPRSLLAWNSEGKIWFITSSSGVTDTADGMRRGGTTKQELAQVARRLGADTAVALDGGGSTALFAHRDGTVQRLDMAQDAWVRPIPVLWQMVAARGQVPSTVR